MSELTISKCREILEECDEVLKKAEPDSQQARNARRKRNWILFYKFKVKETWAVHPQGHDPDYENDPWRFDPEYEDFMGGTEWSDTFAKAMLWLEVEDLNWYMEGAYITRRVEWIDPETGEIFDTKDTIIDPYEEGAKI